MFEDLGGLFMNFLFDLFTYVISSASKHSSKLEYDIFANTIKYDTKEELTTVK